MRSSAEGLGEASDTTGGVSGILEEGEVVG
jgi:hypothetical protein